MNNILITGGAGYIGSHACKALKASGYTPICYDNLVSGNIEAVQWGPFEKGDIRDRDRLSQVIKQYNPKSIMHFAALIQVGESVQNPSIYYNNNVYGSYCLLEEAREHGIENMVFSSTAAVYGNPQTPLIDETHPLSPINPYGQTKLAMEAMIKDYSSSYGINHAILRYFNAAGADPDCETGTAYPKDTHIVPLLMQVASGMMPEIKIFGRDYNTDDGTAIRDYIHVSDLAQAHVLALKYIESKGESLTLNLGTSNGFSVQEVLTSSRKITGQKVSAIDAPRRDGDPETLVANASAAQKLLNWEPTHSSIDEIIRTAWLWRTKQNEKTASLGK